MYPLSGFQVRKRLVEYITPSGICCLACFKLVPFSYQGAGAVLMKQALKLRDSSQRQLNEIDFEIDLPVGRTSVEHPH